jgi:DNA polymerase
MPARVTAGRSLPALRGEAARCRACPLWENATQTVFGEGTRRAQVMLVGEQPGDQEDLAGRPFVGPAGKLLDDVLEEVGIDRRLVYVTNVVKHFKWKIRGKRRIHDKPNWSEIAACRPWLDAELAAVSPQVLVLLGARAVQALLGRKVTLSSIRGQEVESDLAPCVIGTLHPSAVLRAPDQAARRDLRAQLGRDLERVARLL